MNKTFYIFTSILLITSCNNQDVENIINDNSVDWTNENTCSVSIDNEFIDNIIKKGAKIGPLII